MALNQQPYTHMQHACGDFNSHALATENTQTHLHEVELADLLQGSPPDLHGQT